MAAIEATIKNHPAQFLKVIARVLPKDLNLHVNPYDSMTDEQLIARLRVLRDQMLTSMCWRSGQFTAGSSYWRRRAQT